MRIVYVEDNDANLMLVRKVLEATGDAVVIGVASAEEGLTMLEQERPDVLLLDLDLPGMSGLELARTLRAHNELSDLPIVAISASVMKDERGKAAEFVEDVLDLDRGDRSTLQRAQEHAAQRIAERQAEAALERFCNEGRLAVLVAGPSLMSRVLGFLSSCQFLMLTDMDFPWCRMRAGPELFIGASGPSKGCR